MTGVESSKSDSEPPATDSEPPATDWDELAPWWRATFSNGADLEYEMQILPLAAAHLLGCDRILDLGTGEGQLARRLVANVPEPGLVTGIDPYSGQLANALEQGGGPVYVQARGERLPFKSGSFDGVVCCLVIEHADEPDQVLAEMARVLAQGGRLLLLINHPVVQGPGSGFVDDRVLDERYWRIGPYLTEQVVIEEVDPGVPVRFAHRPLSGYINPLCEAGLVLTRLEEPEPPLEFLSDSFDLSLERAMPRLCLMCFEHRAGLLPVGE